MNDTVKTHFRLTQETNESGDRFLIESRKADEDRWRYITTKYSRSDAEQAVDNLVSSGTVGKIIKEVIV